jgi:hypothetical protein
MINYGVVKIKSSLMKKTKLYTNLGYKKIYFIDLFPDDRVRN